MSDKQVRARYTRVSLSDLHSDLRHGAGSFDPA